MAVVERVRAVNPSCHIALFGLYASLNAEHVLAHGVDSVIGGEIEQPLAALARALEAGGTRLDAAPITGVTRAGHPAAPHLRREPLPCPSRAALPSLKRYVHLEREGHLRPTGYVEASRGCKHLCRHCPIPPVYGGRFFAVAAETVMEDIHQQVEAGAAHITFGDPDFLNGPGHALRIARYAPMAPGSPCEDGAFCTTGDQCSVAGLCVGLPNCQDGSPCTGDVCDPATGACFNAPVICGDSDACTIDTCEAATGACL